MATKQKKQAMQLPVHAASGMYVKCIGQCLNASGKVVRKDWYFDPSDLGAAVTKIGELKTRWAALKAAGKTLWDQCPKYAAERSSGAATASRKPSGVMTVSDGFDLFLATIKTAFTNGQCKESHYDSQRFRLKALSRLTVTYRGQQQTFGTLPLPGIARQELEAAVLTLCSRPQVTRHHYEGAADRHEGKLPTAKMSCIYATACKGTLKVCFKWLAGEGVWQLCSHFDNIWKHQVVVTDDELADQLEEEDGEVDHFDLEELQKLWAATDKTLKPAFWKTIILLSLNCAFANAEAATLKAREVKKITDGSFSGEYVIERYRLKTVKKAKAKSWARWYLWPETTALLLTTCTVWDRWHAEKAEAVDPYTTATADEQVGRDYWLTTDEGKMLTANNSIGQGWRRLVKAAGVRDLSFKYLRKTAAHIVRNCIGLGNAEGKSVADMLMSHSESGVITAYAGRDWDQRLKPATEAMRAYLRPMLATVKGEVQELAAKIADDRQRAAVQTYSQNIQATKAVITGKVKKQRISHDQQATQPVMRLASA